MIVKKLIVVSYFIFFSLSLLQAQSTINSQLVSLKTNEPIVFATIRIKNSNIATISDENGYFRIPEEYKTVEDTLLISSIGYKSKQILTKSLVHDKINIIKLVEAVEQLSEVIVYAGKKEIRSSINRKETISPKLVVRTAIQKIPVNYPRKPHSYTGYYRDYQLRNKEYINLNEALIEIFDKGFQSNKIFSKSNQTAILQYKNNPDFKIDSTTIVSYDNSSKKYIKDAKLTAFGGNELSILSVHDPIRNYERNTFSYINTLKKDFVSHHNFTLERVITLDETILYHIKFTTKEEVTGINFIGEGEIYIEKDSFAIHKIQYGVFRVSQNQPFYSNINVYTTNNTIEKIKEENPIFSLRLEYAKKNDLMYLNYISFNNVFRIRNDFKVKEIEYDNTYNKFIIIFNRSFNEKSALKIRNYNFNYLKRPLRVQNIKILKKNKLEVYLKDRITLNEEITIEENSNIRNYSVFTYKLKGIRDTENKKINTENYRIVDQYREFFVQKVFSNKKLPKRALFMLKHKPLKASKNRIFTANNGGSYWINTPLKRNKNDGKDLP